ncbi:(13S,14R)-1,13-dihydroxy-N-methylcanadine 13-O-acetyltransferase AT1 [Camellia lanceoleosa]|uniref:(13S,14R)-1,13-dihydroxy-N-methylcanadine 13-O-acetyltransferase AT1 n=1 Tax=Camellia lanceoleosa TaxID=1840588 RepID=A0ACC0FUQ1_9ERIC|nr:(13S,14R)-1,13-dihydroxy-N-methylcanadine 13-O-acetyltransferase AT1 [Camellia lanceoleosa]
MEIKVEVISRETIKPSSPTPHHLRTHKLSSRDQRATFLYSSVVIFYAPSAIHAISGGGGGGDGDKYDDLFHDISQRLKVSLSETLTHFYPLAGRLKNNLSVDCNDEGIDFFEARVINCGVSDILERPSVQGMVPLAPPEPTDYNNAPLLRVQACSEIALGSPNTVVPDFTAVSSRFPPIEDFPVTSLTFSGKGPKVVTKKFVVDASKIADLKSKTASAGVPQPTRVEAVTALFWKCALVASRSRFGGTRKSYVLRGAINLRSKLVPPLPKHSFGNVVGMFQIIIDKDDDDYESEVTDMSGLVCKMRKGVEESVMQSNNLSTKATPQVKKEYEMEKYYHTSRFSVYEADFGWGKPTWWGFVGQASIRPPGMAVMDTRDGEGVEIWLTLIEEDMAIVEANQELLYYASPNRAAL